MTWLQNSWMDNNTFLAEMAHFAWAYGILLTAALWSATRRQMVCLFLAFVAFAVAKEFWYDLRYEIPTDTVAGSTLDFCVYLAGGLVALAVVWLRRRADRLRNATVPEESDDPFEVKMCPAPRIYRPGEDN